MADKQIAVHNALHNSIATEVGETRDSDIAFMKASLANTCTVTTDTKPKTYQLPLEEISIDEERRLRKIGIGKDMVTGSTKTILIVGATGSGKTTLINALVNYILQVKWEDNYRFRLIDESPEANQAKSQTSWVTTYTLFHQNSFIIPYSLTIVDTPGFGDPSGTERDKEITQQLAALFKSEGPVGIDSLDAVGFVVQSPQCRLTPTQHYIYDSILSLFGKDIADNIFMLITFSDGKKPPVLASIVGAKIPHAGYVKINNSALYYENNNDDEDMNFNEMFWKMGKTSYERFITAVQCMETKSLTLTNEVLMERHQIERYIEALERDMYLATHKSKQLMAEKLALITFERQIKENQNFHYEVEEIRFEKLNLLKGEGVTNCLKCQITCCYPCKIRADSFGLKYLCSSMTWEGHCRCCPDKCSASSHTINDFRFVLKNVKKPKMYDDMKRRYESASGNELTAKQIVEKVEEEFDAIQMHLSLLADKIKASLDRLGKIALKPNQLSTADYIDILIERAKTVGGPHNPDVQVLYAAKEKHIKMVKLSETMGNLTVAKVAEVFDQTQIEMRKNGYSSNVAIIWAAARVKKLFRN